MTDIAWRTAETAPQPADDFSFSRTFLAAIPSHPAEPFPCKTREGRFYDLDSVDNCGEWNEVDPAGLLWADMPKPSIGLFGEESDTEAETGTTAPAAADRVTQVTVSGRTIALDAISVAILDASDDLRRFAIGDEHGFLTFEVAGLECEIETGGELPLSLDIDSGLSISTAYVDGIDPIIDLRYDGRNGDLVERLLEKSEDPVTLGEMTALPDILAPFAGLIATLEDSDGPTWDGWYSINWKLSGDGLLPALDLPKAA